MTICQIPGCQEHYGCRLRDKGVQIGTLATPSKDKKGTLTPTTPNKAWAKCVYDERPDGSKMPILKEDGTPLRVKEASEKPHLLRRLKDMQQAGVTGSDPAKV